MYLVVFDYFMEIDSKAEKFSNSLEKVNGEGNPLDEVFGKGKRIKKSTKKILNDFRENESKWM